MDGTKIDGTLVQQTVRQINQAMLLGRKWSIKAFVDQMHEQEELLHAIKSSLDTQRGLQDREMQDLRSMVLFNICLR